MKLDDLLGRYREELEGAQAPNLEHLFAPTQEVRGGGRRAWYGWAGLAVAAGLVLMVFLGPRGAEEKKPVVAAVKAEVVAPEVVVAQPERTVVAKRSVVARKPEVERATFVALAEMDMLPEPRVYQVVRVSVDEARLVGLGLREARLASGRQVAAQVLLGEDGIARAIRVLGEDRD